jgi:hypothetical protein
MNSNRPNRLFRPRACIPFFACAALTLTSITRVAAQAQTTSSERVVVTGEAIPSPTPHDNWREMRQHIMPEVSGTQITVTKKATTIKLEKQPPVENNNLQELYSKAPGLLVTRLIAGISNLADEQYYSRVFFDGSIEPAPGRSGYAGVSVEF